MPETSPAGRPSSLCFDVGAALHPPGYLGLLLQTPVLRIFGPCRRADLCVSHHVARHVFICSAGSTSIRERVVRSNLDAMR